MWDVSVTPALGGGSMSFLWDTYGQSREEYKENVILLSGNFRP